MEDDAIVVGDVSAMLKLESRIRSFQKMSMVDGKKYRWRYTLIPYQAMARLGFFYCPTKEPSSGRIQKDAVGCIYCRKVTYDFRECRSKKKDVMETLLSVLRQHLDTHTPRCLLAHMKLKILESISNEEASVDWNRDEFFYDPLQERVQDLFRLTFEGNWPIGAENLCPRQMARAGLVKYDSSFTGFEELLAEGNSDASYCIYCKKILGHWQPEDDPLKEHFKSSNGGKCFYFSKLDESLVHTLQQSIDATMKESETYSHSGSAFENSDLSQQLRSNSPEKRRRKLKRNFIKTISDDDHDSDPSYHLNEDKDLVLDFESHKQRSNELERKNAILDDSKDEFSFSAHGHSAFEIPPHSTKSKIATAPNIIGSNPQNCHAALTESPDGIDLGPLSNRPSAQEPLDAKPRDATSELSSEYKPAPVQGPRLDIEKVTPLKILSNGENFFDSPAAETAHHLLSQSDELSEESSSHISTLDTGTPLSKGGVTDNTAIAKVNEQYKNGVEPNNDIEDGNVHEKHNSEQEESNDGFHEEAPLREVLPPEELRNYNNSNEYETNGEMQQQNIHTRRTSSPAITISNFDRESNTNRTITSKASNSQNEKMFKMDEDKNLVKNYFHDMLRYINNNDATLANDRDGDLTFFMKQMPSEEMDIPFSQWITKKKEALQKEFQEDVKQKLRKLRDEFNHAIENIGTIENEETLIAMAERLGVYQIEDL
ncbi:uncharacterized protein ZBAI_08308 [Zygosaccharomyces bailii ISA1307]|nr:uncharacterized protein ZBAI_08308 [Zygosaccharomyces bailii ISA1307]